jgi:hypothetical protein
LKWTLRTSFSRAVARPGTVADLWLPSLGQNCCAGQLGVQHRNSRFIPALAEIVLKL